MAIEFFHDLPQGSPEWLAARAGILTASEFADALREKGRGEGGTSVSRQKLLYRLAGEKITGEPAESYSNGYMERGHAWEDEARKLYGFMNDAEPVQVGFARDLDKGVGCSPDSLVGEHGGLEIKTRTAALQIELLKADRVPPEHVAQIQGCMWVTGRRWWDFVSFSRGLPIFIRRVERDELYLAKLARGVAAFNEELAALVAEIRSMEAAA